MTQRFTILLILSVCIAVFSFFSLQKQEDLPLQVKQLYKKQCGEFAASIKKLQQLAAEGNEKKLQDQFVRMRLVYKKTEVFTEYFFSFYATKLNGPPIPFFEEAEADAALNLPGGMQVIEEILFPQYKYGKKKELVTELNELARYATELPSINESFSFTDATVFDAIMEELYRITAMGITGFDSQTAQNSLPECAAAIQSLQQYTALYKNMFIAKMPDVYDTLQLHFKKAIQYLDANKNFNQFNRLYFIKTFLNPITKLTGAFKTAYTLTDSNAGLYYSAIKKNNTLFAKDAFNANRFIDDYATSAEKIELGRMLFFEKQLSANNSRSCASCHQPNKAFTDGLPTSLALDGHTRLPRNAPTILNAALQRNLFADSRSRNLEEQVMQVLNSNTEMHGSAQKAAEKIIASENYKAIYSKAYPAAQTSMAALNICNAIACYERTLIALNSRFDRHMNGDNLLTENEVNGFNIFMGKAKCGTCHFMPLFGGAKPPRYYYMESEVIGVPANKNKKNAVLDNDSGRYHYTGYNIHLFSFKTPSLRNAALTAPYMHNGIYNTLEEVIDFYNDGGGKGLGIAPKNQSLPFDKLGLTFKEKKDLAAFIKSLTDTATAH